MKKKNIIGGTLILSFAGIICKILGAFTKIPLTNILKSEGIGIYQLIFPLYSLLLLISSSGIPIAISKIISEKNNIAYAKAVLRYALKFVIILSLILTFLVILLSKSIALLQGNAKASFVYLAISPAIIFVAIISVIRGYFQGLNDFKPTAISQIIEQAFKIILSLALAYILTPINLVLGVVGAVIGITASEIVSALYLIFLYKKNVSIVKDEQNFAFKTNEIRNILLKTAVPITLTSVILPLLSLIDSVMFVQGLLRWNISANIITSFYGVESGIVSSLLNLPVVVSTAISSSLIPLIASNNNSNKNCKLAFKSIIFVMIPIIVFYIFFSEPILKFLFSNAFKNEVVLMNYANVLLKITSVSMLYISIMQICTSIIQAKSCFWFPLKIYAIAGVIKVILNFLFLSIKQISIYSISISSVLMYFIISLILLIAVKKHTEFKLDYCKNILYPLCLVTIVCIILQPLILSIDSTIVNLLIGGMCYVILTWIVLILMNYFEKDELPNIKFKKRLKVNN